MAIVSQNNLGKLRKKSGPNTFRKWRTHLVMSVYVDHVNDRNSEAQQLVRARFRIANQLAAAMRSVINIGFDRITSGLAMFQGNYFIRENFASFTADTPDSTHVDYSELVFAKGDLPESQFGSLDFTDPLTVKAPITDTSSMIGASDHDLVYFFAYNPDAGAMIMAEPFARDEQAVELVVPAYWIGSRVHVYAFTVGGGIDNDGVRSNSRYLGAGTIV